MPTTRGFAFRVNHGLAQSDYVNWKYQELKDLTNSPPRICKRCYYFRTVSHPAFDELHAAFYVDGKKQIPEQLAEWITPLAFTVWLMDDGARDGHQIRINTQSFSEEENRLLVVLLQRTLGISATLNRDKDRFRLRIGADSMEQLRSIAAPHLLSCMNYKLSCRSSL